MLDQKFQTQSTLSASSCAVLITDPAGGLLYVSPNTKEVLNLPCEENVFLKEIIDQLRGNGENEPAGLGIPLTANQDIVLKDADDNAGFFAAAVHEIALPGCHRLITVRQDNERNIKEKLQVFTEQAEKDEFEFSHVHFEYLLKHDPNAVAVFDRNMHYLMVSDKYLEDNALSGKDIIGRNHYEIFPDMPDRWRSVHQRVLSGAIERNTNDWVERPDGTIHYTRWQCRPWYDRNNSICGLVLYTEDITDRKLTEDALKRSESQMRHLLDSTFEAIVGVDRHGICTFINRSGIELLGYDSADELVGKKMHDVYHHSSPDGSCLPESECLHLTALKTGKSLHTKDAVFWRKDGASFPVSCRLQPFDLNNGPTGGVVTFLDISEQIIANEEKQKLEQEIRHYQKMDSIGTLAGGIAHDFNNILSGIIGYGELMEIFEAESRAEMMENGDRV